MDSIDDILYRSIETAKKYHAGQVDKNGEEYILHPLRVMEQMETTEGKIVAVLHDVIEDTACTKEMLFRLIGCEDLVNVIDLLSRKEEENYFDYIQKVRSHPLAKAVKLADLRDNLGRPGAPESLRRRYQKALRMLQN